jgi:hypothetical protein
MKQESFATVAMLSIARSGNRDYISMLPYTARKNSYCECIAAKLPGKDELSVCRQKMRPVHRICPRRC